MCGPGTAADRAEKCRGLRLVRFDERRAAGKLLNRAVPREDEDLELAIWAVADGRATADHLALFKADTKKSMVLLGDMIDDIEDQLDDIFDSDGDERDMVVADLEKTLDQFFAIQDIWMPEEGTAPIPVEEAAELRLQASWSEGSVVVWAGGPLVAPASNDQLADLLEAIGGPSVGWNVHPGVPLPGGGRAEALSIPVRDALGWLVAVGAGLGRDGVGPSVVWLGRVAIEAVRIVGNGSFVPTLRWERGKERSVDAHVQWEPAMLDAVFIAKLGAAMPGPVSAVAPSDGKATTAAVLSAVVNAIVGSAAAKLTLPAPPPVVVTGNDLAEAFMTRVNGSTFAASSGMVSDASRRLDDWARSVTSLRRPKLVVQLDAPDSGDAWMLHVLGRGPTGQLMPVEQALSATRETRPIADELARLERLYPPLLRPGALRRGQVVLSQSGAWDLMATVGETLVAAGFDVRMPEISRKKPSPSLRLFAIAEGESVVGAHQLANVSWTVLFDDVELTADDVRRLAREARPLVKSHGKWIELDEVDLREAAAALAERATTKQMTGAEILRHAIGLESSGLAGGVSVGGSGWATELLEKAKAVPTTPISSPKGFVGELRSYQAQAVGWLGFLDSAGLGGCLALDMGLGKTPTMLAHLANTAGEGQTLVIAPPAVVGNWAAEARKFVPGLRVLVHHGGTRADDDELEREFSGVDIVITTYGTAVRDIDGIGKHPWARVVLDEAQAIKNSTSQVAQLLRGINARSRVALTGTPVENGLGDLWSILDFTNPGLVGSRSTFIAQMAGEAEAGLRALNGILVFRRTKTEPEVAAELPDKIDELDHCTMTPEQIGLYQAVLDKLIVETSQEVGGEPKQGAVLAAITALKQICNHPAAYNDDDLPLSGRSGKLARLEEIIEQVYAANERILVFTHFASWGRKLATYLTEKTKTTVHCYDGSLARGTRDRTIEEFQNGVGPGVLVLSLKAGGTGLNLTAASHVVLYDRWWNPAVEDQARDRAWRIGQTKTVVSHRLVCPGTVDERVEEVVAGKRHIADLVLPKSSSLSDLSADQLRIALGLRPTDLLTADDDLIDAEVAGETVSA
jgi:SNF2-related domain/SNF2 Helicase protein/Helicase conserved C-terminal domain